MRKESKYKLIYSTDGFLKSFPLRVLKFKRPKWSKIQKTFSQNLRKVHPIVNIFNVKKTSRSWEKIKRYYKKGFRNKNFVYSLFDKSVKFSRLKKKSSGKFLKKDYILNYLVKPQFRLDILLYRSNFFSSIHEARQSVLTNKVYVNEKTVNPNIYLKKGDLISFSPSFKFNYVHVSQRLSLVDKFSSFLEHDYYTNNVVVIKDYDNLSEEDFYLLITDYIDLKSFTYNI